MRPRKEGKLTEKRNQKDDNLKAGFRRPFYLYNILIIVTLIYT